MESISEWPDTETAGGRLNAHSTIVEGVVIDHIPAGGGMELYRYLGLDKRCQVALIKNASSTKMKKKGYYKNKREY